jgi:hypothetical protein
MEVFTSSLSNEESTMKIEFYLTNDDIINDTITIVVIYD